MAEQKLPKLLTSAVFRRSASQNTARNSRLETNAWVFRAKQSSASPAYFSSRASFSSTASRMNFGRPYVPAILSTRSRVSGANRIGTGFRCRGGRPIRGALSGAVALFKKTILFSVDGLNDAVYVNGIVFECKDAK